LILIQFRNQKRQCQLIIVDNNTIIVLSCEYRLNLSLTLKLGESKKVGSIGCLREENICETVSTIMEDSLKVIEVVSLRIATGIIDGE